MLLWLRRLLLRRLRCWLVSVADILAELTLRLVNELCFFLRVHLLKLLVCAAFPESDFECRLLLGTAHTLEVRLSGGAQFRLQERVRHFKFASKVLLNNVKLLNAHAFQVIELDALSLSRLLFRTEALLLLPPALLHRLVPQVALVFI